MMVGRTKEEESERGRVVSDFDAQGFEALKTGLSPVQASTDNESGPLHPYSS